MTDDVIEKGSRDKSKRVWVDIKNKKAFILDGMQLTELKEKRRGEPT